jgi:hypothetical protein
MSLGLRKGRKARLEGKDADGHVKTRRARLARLLTARTPPQLAKPGTPWKTAIHEVIVRFTQQTLTPACCEGLHRNILISNNPPRNHA